MADNIWEANTDNDANTATNWSLGTVPTGTDDIVFDSVLGHATANCNLSGNISCTTLKFVGAYSGTIDLVASNLTLSGDIDCTNGDDASIFLGSGSHNWAGNVDCFAIGDWQDNESTVELSGSGILTPNSNTFARFLLISGNYTQNASPAVTLECDRDFTISGTFTTARTVKIALQNFTFEVTSTGTFAGVGSFQTTGKVSVDVKAGGTWSATGTIGAGHTFTRGCNFLTPATYTGPFVIEAFGSVPLDAIFPAGVTTFEGPVTFDSNRAANTFNIDTSAGANLVFEDDLTLKETLGTLGVLKGAGSITFSGTSGQTFILPTTWITVLEPIVIDKDAGMVTLSASDMYCESLDVQKGDLYIGPNTIDSLGSVTVNKVTGGRLWNGTGPGQANGQIAMAAAGVLTLKGVSVGDRLFIDDLDFEVPIGVTFDVEYCDVTNSQNTGTLDIDATDGTSRDDGSPPNDGWDFGGAPPAFQSAWAANSNAVIQVGMMQ